MEAAIDDMTSRRLWFESGPERESKENSRFQTTLGLFNVMQVLVIYVDFSSYPVRPDAKSLVVLSIETSRLLIIVVVKDGDTLPFPGDASVLQMGMILYRGSVSFRLIELWESDVTMTLLLTTDLIILAFFLFKEWINMPSLFSSMWFLGFMASTTFIILGSETNRATWGFLRRFDLMSLSL